MIRLIILILLHQWDSFCLSQHETMDLPKKVASCSLRPPFFSVHCVAVESPLALEANELNH